MTPPSLAWYDSTDATIITTLALTDIPGTTGAALELHLWNDNGGATPSETALNVRVLIMERNPGETYFVGSGRPLTDGRWVQARIVGSAGGVVAILTGWVAIGAGASIPLPDIPDNSSVKMQFRVVAPGTFMESTAIEVTFSVQTTTSQAIGMGHTTDPDGVFSGIGDAYATFLIVGGMAAPSGTPDNVVHLPYQAGVSAGVPWAVAATTETLSNTDSAAVALVSGEEYQALVTGGHGGLTVTKGLKATVGSSLTPALPAGAVLVANVTVPFSAAIDASRIVSLALLTRYGFSSSGLIATVGPGDGRVDNFITHTNFPQLASLTDASTNRLWLMNDGSIAVTQTAAPPVPGACLLWEAVTVAGAVTALTDRRLFIGPALRRLALRFNAPLAAANLSTYEVNPESRALYLDPQRAAVLAVDDLGSGLTAGVSRIDLQVSDAGGAWTSIFPDAGSMLQVAYNSTNEVSGACAPAILTIPAGSRVRARVDAIPTGTTPPQGATVIIGGLVR
jgi:hypothetical protein